MIPNRCAKTRVRLDEDTVVQAYSCFVNHPRELPPDEWKLLGDVLVDIHSAKLLGWHDTKWFTNHDDTILAAKIDADVDERSANFIRSVQQRLAENPYTPPTDDIHEVNEVNEVHEEDETSPDALSSSDNTHSESKGHTSTTLQASFEKLTVD